MTLALVLCSHNLPKFCTFDIHENDLVTTCDSAIPSVAKTLKKIHISTTIFN